MLANRRESTISKIETKEMSNNQEPGEYVFKRNLSLPFRKHITPCRAAAVNTGDDKPGLKPMTKSSPHLPKIATSLVHSSSKVKFTKQAGHVSPLNRQTSMKVTPSSGYTKRQTKSISSLKSSSSNESSGQSSEAAANVICRRNSSILNRPLMPLPNSSFMPIKASSTRLSDCHLQIRLRMAQMKQQHHQHVLAEYETQV